MDLKNYLLIDDYQLKRFERIYAQYKMLYEDPDNCSPMIIVDVSVDGLPTWEERLADPLIMLKAELDTLRPHLEIGDDCVPTVRVQFGTAQIPAAFGCELAIPTNSLPAAKTHVIKSSKDVYKMKKPTLNAGWYGKLKEYTEVFLENLSISIHIQHPDVQSPFNNAHLIRGNDILLDFYDDPDAVDALLDLVTDYMVDLIPYLKQMIGGDKEWFFDWGALWKGTARISNCSVHMISPELYKKHVLPQDIRLMRAIGGGRVHYCGTSDKVIDEFFNIDEISGLDYDGKYHDLWDLSERAPKRLALLQYVDIKSPVGQRLIAGDWPKKRNIIITTSAASIEEGKEIFIKLKSSSNG